MASPQKENGFLALSTEIVDNLCHYRITGEQWNVLWVVLRKTYGWNKKEDQISISQFEKLTQIKRSSIVRAIKSLVANKLLCSSKGATGITTTYSFQKDYNKWKVVPKKLLSPKHATIDSPKDVNRVVPNMLHTIDTIQQPLLQKTITPTFDFESLWVKYPRKIGKDDALRHFKSQIKKDEDYAKIIKALDNFILSDQGRGDIKFIPHGSRWFNKIWKDYADIKNFTGKSQAMLDMERMIEDDRKRRVSSIS